MPDCPRVVRPRDCRVLSQELAGVARALRSFLRVVHVYALLRVYTPCTGIILCGAMRVYALVARTSVLLGKGSWLVINGVAVVGAVASGVGLRALLRMGR